ncbi:MAG: hypothetical protein Q7R54_00515 [bacterium]|nr:hypothetical protein [bacterium]
MSKMEKLGGGNPSLDYTASPEGLAEIETIRKRLEEEQAQAPDAIVTEKTAVSFNDLRETAHFDEETSFSGFAPGPIDPVEHAENVADLRKVVEAFKDLKSPKAPDADLLETFGHLRETSAIKPEIEKVKTPPTLEQTALVLAEKAGVEKERAAMLDAERAFIEARRAKKLDKAKVVELEGKYNAQSAEYEQKLEERLAPRFAQKFEAGVRKEWDALQPADRPKGQDGKEISFTEHLHKKADAQKERINAFARRYRSMIASRDIIDRGEKHLDEALASKERGPVKKLLAETVQWAARQNQALENELGKKGARAARILCGAAIGATGASFLGAGVAAFGLSALGFRLARVAVGTVAGSWVGAKAGKRYEETRGLQHAQELQAAREQVSSSTDGIKNKRAAYRRGSKEAIAKKRKYVEMGSAAAVGGLTSFFTGLGWSNEAAAATAEKIAPLESVQKALETLEAPSSTHVDPSISVSISEKGEGAIKLFTHLQDSLKEQGLTVENTAPDSDAQYILSHTPDQASVKYGFLTKEGSRWMHGGDTFTIDPEGKFSAHVSREGFQSPPVSPKGEEAITRDLNLQEVERAESLSVTPDSVWQAPDVPSQHEVLQTEPTLLSVEGTPVLETPPFLSRDEALEAFSNAPPAEAPTAPIDTEVLDPSQIDARKADWYLDTKGDKVIYGGSLQQRIEEVVKWIERDHTAVIYFDTQKSGFFNSLFSRHHLAKAYFDEATGSIQTLDDTIDPTLRGRPLPGPSTLQKHFSH